MDPHYLKKHPEVYKRICYGLIEDIFDKFCAEVSPRWASSYTAMKPQLEASLKSHVDLIWDEVDMNRKAADLVEMIENANTDEPQWRPKLGEVDISQETVICNIQMKKRLTQQIEEKKAEIAELEQTITAKRDKVNERMVEIVKIQNEISNSYKQIQKNKVVSSTRK